MSGAIRSIIAEIAPRTSATVVCPWCEGGSRKRRTLSIDLRDGIWLWICHRGSCSMKGAMPDRAGTVPAKAAFTPRRFLEATRLPHNEDDITIDRLRRSGIEGSGTVEDFCIFSGLRVLESDPTTMVWECRGFGGTLLGHLTRDADKNIKTYKIKDGPLYAYFRGDDYDVATDQLWIVEDPLSAAVLADQGRDSVALLGTHLSMALAKVIADQWPKEIIVCLDPDGAGRAGALKAVGTLRSLGIPTRNAYVPVDVKDLSPAERTAFLSLYLPRA